MAWLVARIRQRAGARRATGDRLGYIRGGTGALATAFARRIESEGVRLILSARVSSLRWLDGRWVATFTTPDGEAEVAAARVIACVSGPVLARLVELPAPYREAVAAIPFRGIVCVLLELTESLSRHYWVNVTDRLGLGCVGIIEHTNLVEPERYGGRRLVYLAHYVDRSDPAWTATADELIEPVLPAFRSLNPRFREEWIVDAHVARDPFAQPVPLAGGPDGRPADGAGAARARACQHGPRLPRRPGRVEGPRAGHGAPLDSRPGTRPAAHDDAGGGGPPGHARAVAVAGDPARYARRRDRACCAGLRGWLPGERRRAVRVVRRRHPRRTRSCSRSRSPTTG